MRFLPEVRINYWALGGVACVFIFALFYPTHFLIADEWQYFEQARNWSTGSTNTYLCPPCPGPCNAARPGEYPPGTALLAILFIWAGGPTAVFWQSLLCWLLGLWAIAHTLRQYDAPAYWIAYAALFLPALALTRTLMSDMPSFLLAALFLRVFLGWQNNRAGRFAAGFIGGLALLFRETNILWVLPFLSGALVRKLPFATFLWAGFLAGLVLRLLSSAWLYDHPFFVKDPGISFALRALPANLFFYSVLLMVLLPGSLWLWWNSRHPSRSEIGWCAGLLLLAYGCYDYPAFAKSGYKALVLQGRFLVPLVPFLTLAAATATLGAQRWMKTGLALAAGILFPAVQAAGWWFNTEQKKLTAALNQLPVQTHISFSPEESVKYLNALYDSKKIVNGLEVFPDGMKCQTQWYVHLLSRSETTERRKKANWGEQVLFNRFKAWNIVPVHNQLIGDGTRLRIWRLQLRGNHE
ncbi:MAG: hypothetical protein IPH12_10525 [Saprospirales bacterium]|nr:hypothetical protein [Saprospirales bacterium]MBK8922247.1 hypothetical protein [Saprospirales bacterium]